MLVVLIISILFLIFNIVIDNGNKNNNKDVSKPKITNTSFGENDKENEKEDIIKEETTNKIDDLPQKENENKNNVEKDSTVINKNNSSITSSSNNSLYNNTSSDKEQNDSSNKNIEKDSNLNNDEKLWQDFKNDPLTFIILESDIIDFESFDKQNIEAKKWQELGYRVELPKHCIDLTNETRCVYSLSVYIPKGICKEITNDIKINWRDKLYISAASYANNLGYNCEGYRE